MIPVVIYWVEMEKNTVQLCVIHGSPNSKGNTVQAYKRFESFLIERDPGITVKEFHLQKDFNEFCRGCYTCFLKSEEKCPHRAKLKPILEAMFDADGLVFTSPSYVLAESAQMKAFLDHLGWLFLPHRADPRMFTKSAMLIATAAGAGTKQANKCVRRSLRFWGVPSILRRGFNLFEIDMEKVKEKRMAKLDKRLCRDADRFYRSLHRKKHVNLFTWVLLKALRPMIKSHPADNIDKMYWKKMGWV